MRGSRPGFWKQYEASQLGVAVACMTHTKRTAFRPAAATDNSQTVTRPAAPAASCVFVIGPMVGSLDGRRVLHS
jgi:hypothetical protein